MKNLYCGYVRDVVLRCFTDDSDPTFMVSTIPVIVHETYMELPREYPMTVDSEEDFGTYTLYKDVLDVQHTLEDGSVLYSFDKQKCDDFVSREYTRWLEKLDQHIDYLQTLKSMVHICK